MGITMKDGKVVWVPDSPMESPAYTAQMQDRVSVGMGANPGEAAIKNWGNTNVLDIQKKDAVGEVQTGMGYSSTEKKDEAGGTKYTNPYVDADGNMTGYGMAQSALGLGQLGLGVAGYLDNRETAKMNRELMGQQIASNTELMATRQKRAKDIGAAFGGRPGLGA